MTDLMTDLRTLSARIARIFSPNSPLGPGMGGMLSVLVTVLVGLIITPIVMKATFWWWSLWLQFPR